MARTTSSDCAGEYEFEPDVWWTYIILTEGE